MSNQAPEDPFALTGTTLERRFAIEQLVARGGFGVVYRARHLNLKKTVAIKVLSIPPSLKLKEKQLFLASFEREAQTIAQLEHPAIVRAYDFGIARLQGRPELPWLALEWLEGQELEQFLLARGATPLRPAEALALLRPVFQGLAYAHAQHVAHRDLKPANIMLLQGSAAKLLDFGIAKAMNPDEDAGSGATRTLSAFSAYSTPYAAPEQKDGRKTGPWTDVHALGLILTELLTGQAPYPGENVLQVEMRILSEQRPTPALFGVDVGAWEPLLAKAVALRTPDRFPEAGSFLAALEASLPQTTPQASQSPAVSSLPVATAQSSVAAHTNTHAMAPAQAPVHSTGFHPPASGTVTQHTPTVAAMGTQVPSTGLGTAHGVSQHSYAPSFPPAAPQHATNQALPTPSAVGPFAQVTGPVTGPYGAMPQHASSMHPPPPTVVGPYGSGVAPMPMPGATAPMQFPPGPSVQPSAAGVSPIWKWGALAGGLSVLGLLSVLLIRTNAPSSEPSGLVAPPVPVASTGGGLTTPTPQSSTGSPSVPSVPSAPSTPSAPSSRFAGRLNSPLLNDTIIESIVREINTNEDHADEAEVQARRATEPTEADMQRRTATSLRANTDRLVQVYADQARTDTSEMKNYYAEMARISRQYLQQRRAGQRLNVD